MTFTPEQRARERIDALLRAAGWILQDNAEFNRNAGEGVAVREFLLPNGPCDYLLFVGGRAAGVVEAKKSGVTLSSVAEQAGKYLAKVPGHCRSRDHQAARPRGRRDGQTDHGGRGCAQG
jgi:type I restriction enzyme R subunit